MVDCCRCGAPILSINHSRDGYHIKCWRLSKGRFVARRAKKYPGGTVRPTGRVEYHIQFDIEYFDKLAKEYVDGDFQGTFAAYLRRLIECGRKHDNL